MSPLDAAQGGVGMKWFGGWRLQIRFVPPERPDPPHFFGVLEGMSRDYNPTDQSIGTAEPLTAADLERLRRDAPMEPIPYQVKYRPPGWRPDKAMDEFMGEFLNDPINSMTTAHCEVCGIGVTVPYTHDVAMCGACYQSLGDLPPIVKVANPDGVHRVWHFADGSTSQLASNRIIELGRAAIAPEVRLVRKVTV